MFTAIRVTGAEATLLLGGATTAAVLGAWSITPAPAPARGVWKLTARVRRLTVPPQMIRARGLVFTSPRAAGFWCWPVRAIVVAGDQVRADLGPPEQ